MSIAAAAIYWVIVAIWGVVLGSVVFFYLRNPKAFGTTRLLLIVVGLDTFRNIFENAYFGVYFGGQYGLFPQWTVTLLGQPALLIIPKLLNVVAGCIVLGLLLYHWLPVAIREWTQLEQRAARLQALADIDALTGLSNRRHFENLARAELARCQRYMRPLSLLVVDIDHFKSVNDRLGHAAGDLVLRDVATTIVSAKRDSDVVARIGGEEFALLIPEANRDSARAFAERLCELVRTRSATVEGQNFHVSVSIGIAEATVRTAGLETLMREADQALYEAKRLGRDRVIIAKSPVEKVSTAAE